MKSNFFVVAFIVLLSTNISGQAPQSFKYQTVVRNANGEIIANQPVNITLSILQGSITGTSVCTELFQSTTNEFGLVNLEIGSLNPSAFSAINWANGPYFVKVELNGNEMGASELLSVPYALYAEQSGNAGGNELWSENGSNIYFNGGNVGIGTTNPSEKLHIIGDVIIDGGEHTLQLKPSNNDNTYIEIFADSDNPNLRSGWIGYGSAGSNDFSITNSMTSGNIILSPLSGNVGIGTYDPKATFQVTDDDNSWGDPAILVEGLAGSDQVALGFRSSDTYDWEFAGIHDGRLVIRDEKNQIAKITIYPGPSGAVAVPVLEITGGSDLAEPFPINETLEEGTVVIIDEANPGHLIQSNQPYDKKVAGIVSGAGGIQPGLTLKQEGVMEGSQNIALTGRVYVKATTENGVIKPGDLLTTSSLPGHAMIATDMEKSFGTVIGKAMSSLEEGEGLVLVLVNLQ